jgi:hypothetical protein
MLVCKKWNYVATYCVYIVFCKIIKNITLAKPFDITIIR